MVKYLSNWAASFKLWRPYLKPFLLFQLAMGVVGLVGLGIGAWGIWQISNTPDQVVYHAGPDQTLVTTLPDELAQLEASNDQAASPKPVTVYVSGAVKNPGIYQLEETARVGDALGVAGGPQERADDYFLHKSLNLAAGVSDGQHIYIPSIDEQVSQETVLSSSSTTTPATSTKTSINTASLDALDALPGIGPARAQQIIDSRPYDRVEELTLHKIIPESVFDQIQTMITI